MTARHRVWPEQPHIDISWIKHSPDVELCQDLADLGEPGPISRVIVFDAQPWTPQRRDLLEQRWLAAADRVVMVVSDQVEDLVHLLHQVDQPRTHAVVTGAVQYQPRDLRIWRYENFFRTMQQLYQDLGWPDPESRGTPADSWQFDALLGAVDGRWHRQWLFDRIQHEPGLRILCRSYCSDVPMGEAPPYFEFPAGVVASDASPVGYRDNTGHFFSSREYQYRGRPVVLSHILPWNIYARSTHSIVCETSIQPGFCFFTEKIVKPIMAQRMFVVYASPLYLTHLRELGFRTFDHIIDERYDLEPDPERRFQMAWQQVRALANSPGIEHHAAVRAVLQHNHDWFWTQDWHSIYNRAMINAVTL